MESRTNASGWYHSIIVTHDNKVISVTTRDFNHDTAGLLHRILGVELNTEKHRKVTQIESYTYAELINVLLMFANYQQYKEIEFLKVCIDYLSKNPGVEKLDFTFYNE